MRSALPEVEGEAIGRTQPVRSQCDWDPDCVSQKCGARAKRSTYRSLNRRTLTEIQKRVTKRGKRSAALRFILSKDDKDKIAVWKQDLVRVLHVFNVRSTGSVENL